MYIMKKSWLFCLLIAAVAVSACQMLSQLPSQNSTQTASQSTPATQKPGGKYQYIFKPAVKPIHLSIELDQASKTQAIIGPAGGKISAKGADGTIYSLEIPEKALANDIKISMTPLSKLSGMPFDGKTSYAVQLEPEGLYLYYDAILSITPAKPIPLAQQLFFGYQAAGQSVGLAMPVLKTQELKLRLMHFSGYGVADGSAADTASIEGQLGGDARSAIQSLTGELLARMRQNQENGNAYDPQMGQELIDLMDQWEREVVQPSLEAAASSCQAGKDAMRDLLDLERMRELLGADPSSANFAKVRELAKTGAIVCIKEEYQRCVDEHVITGMIPWYIDQLRQQELENDNGAVVSDSEGVILARDLTTKCLTFELQFHSQGQFDTRDGGYSSTVDGKIMLHFDPASFMIKGSGPLDNLSFEFHPPANTKSTVCNTDSKPGGATAEVKALEYVTETAEKTDIEPDPKPHLRDFNLLYFPGLTSESYNIHCIYYDGKGKKIGEVGYNAPPSGYWTGIFFVLHQDELNAGSAGPVGAEPPSMPDMAGIKVGAIPPMPVPTMPADGGFFANEFEVTPGDVLLASKEWIKDNPSINLTESGTLKLRHKPGQ